MVPRVKRKIDQLKVQTWETKIRPNLPLVSVVMPTYNHASFIGDAIRSVISQSYRNWELVVVNNFSHDKTKEIVSNFLTDERIREFDFANGGIIAASRNFGIRKAAGELIAFLDSDDLWEANKLDIQVSHLMVHPEIDLACTNARYYPKRTALSATVVRRKTGVVGTAELVGRNPVLNSSVLLRASVVRELGPMSEDPALRASEDYEYWVRVSLRRDRSILYDSRPLISYRVHDSNVLSSAPSPEADSVYRNQRRRVFRILTLHGAEMTPALRRQGARQWAQRTQFSILEGRLRRRCVRPMGALRFPALPFCLRVVALAKSVVISGVRTVTRR